MVNITGMSVLLDGETERLGGVVVGEGGRLVFMGGANPVLRTRYLLIEDGGEVCTMCIAIVEYNN